MVRAPGAAQGGDGLDFGLGGEARAEAEIEVGGYVWGAGDEAVVG
jgi:hypothetical protein